MFFVPEIRDTVPQLEGARRAAKNTGMFEWQSAMSMRSSARTCLAWRFTMFARKQGSDSFNLEHPPICPTTVSLARSANPADGGRDLAVCDRRNACGRSLLHLLA